MRWLIDEMFSASVAAELERRGHHARAVVSDLRGLTDDQVLETAVADGRVLVTENVVDFVALLEQRHGAGEASAPVVFVRKQRLPRDPHRLSRVLADRLDRWAEAHPEPLATAYWL